MGGMNDVNGLTNEFMKVYNAVRARWTQGLGKYLLVKLADSMAKGGILEVGKNRGREGQWVFVNGKALGLSNKMTSSPRSVAASTTTSASSPSSPRSCPLSSTMRLTSWLPPRSGRAIRHLTRARSLG